MNKHLNFYRLGLVFKKFWFENRKSIFFMQAAILVLLTLWLGVYLAFTNTRLFREDFQIAYYFSGLLLSGCLSANMLFSELNSKPRKIGFLLTPASSLEKAACVLFFGVVVFFTGYTISFYMVDSLMVTLTNRFNDSHWSIINIFSLSGFRDPFFNGNPNDLFLKYFTCQALFILGSVFFPRYSFFKTVIVCFFIWVILFLSQALVRSFLPEGGSDRMIPLDMIIFDYHASKRLKMPEWFIFSFDIFSLYFITAALWLASFFRLKETEV